MPRKSAEDMFVEAILEGMMNAGRKQPNISKEAVKGLAQNNKILFDEHVKVGFTEEQSMQIITAIINKL